METLGVWLRQTREAQDSTLEQAEDVTRIKPRYLEALEAGNFAAFPGGQVQARGFLRLYARYLDLSPDEVLTRYDAEVLGIETASASAPAQVQSTSPAPPTAGPGLFRSRGAFTTVPRPPIMWGRLAIVSLVIIVLLAVIVAGGYFIVRNGSEETPAAPAAATEPAQVETPLAEQATSVPLPVAPTLPANPDGGVTLDLEATEHVWTRITVDGMMVFEGQLAPEQVETWSGQATVTVDTGNGAGLLVTVNGQLMGAMCGRNEVCTRAWGPDGEIDAP